jgi:hypothetical protein
MPDVQRIINSFGAKMKKLQSYMTFDINYDIIHKLMVIQNF